MCLAVFDWSPNDDVPFTVVANRDEFRARPTASMDWWTDLPILAGKDLEAGGTWLGLNKDKKFALLTNIRPGYVGMKGELSRGHLVTEFLATDVTIQSFHQTIVSKIDRYAGFNLVLSDGDKLFWFSSTNPAGQWLKPGIHAVSNDSLDTPWPKLELAKQQMIHQRDALIKSLTNHSILQDKTQAPEQLLPNTGVPLQWEQKLSAQTITGSDYGTRCRTHIVIDRQQRARVAEQQIDTEGAVISTHEYEF